MLRAVVLVLVLALLPGTAASASTRPAFPSGGRFDYQIGGAYRPAKGIVIVDRDRHDRPAPGAYNICYVNAFQAQPEELAWWKRHHPSLLLRDRAGHLVIDTGWDEVLLDISTPRRRTAVAAVVGSWIARCARDGFDAVEPDNLDSWTRSHHLLTASDAVAFAALLSSRAHAAGLLIAQKNASELAKDRSRTHFDFAIAEECAVYAECGYYTKAYGRRVIEIEYTDNGRTAFARSCAARGHRISIELADRDVEPAGTPGHVRRWCS